MVSTNLWVKHIDVVNFLDHFNPGRNRVEKKCLKPPPSHSFNFPKNQIEEDLLLKKQSVNHSLIMTSYT